MKCIFTVVVTRPMLKAEQRKIKEEQIAAEQQAHETELLTVHHSSEPLRN